VVAKVEKLLKQHHGAGFAGRKVVVFGGTGVVGFASAIIAVGEGARAEQVGYDGEARVRHLAESAKKRFSIEVGYADGSTGAAKLKALADAEVAFAAGKAGVQVLGKAELAKAPALKVAADVNAVPPPGIEGIGLQDDGKPIEGSKALGLGPLAVGNIKYKVQAGLLRRMIESDKAIYLDFRDAFTLARQLVG